MILNLTELEQTNDRQVQQQETSGRLRFSEDKNVVEPGSDGADEE